MNFNFRLIKLTKFEPYLKLHRLTGPITVINPDPDVPYLEFGDVKLYLTEELFVLHPELETFVFGGREGPVLGTDFHIVFNLKNAPDDAIIALTCVFMNNCSYKNLFVEEQQPTVSKIFTENDQNTSSEAPTWD